MTNLITTSTAFALGAFHAIEPGHGKSFIASYMIGKRTNTFQVLMMSASMAISHTIALFALGLLLAWFIPSYAKDNELHFVEIIAPVLMMSIGVYLLYKSIKSQNAKQCNCTHHTQKSKSSNKTNLAVAFATGFIPCPSALAAFSLAGANGALNQSFWFVLLYVLGFILVMMLIAVIISFASIKVSKVFTTSNLAKHFEKISSVMIITVGFIYLIRFFAHNH